MDRREFAKAMSGAMLAAMVVGPTVFGPRGELVQYGSFWQVSGVLVAMGVDKELSSALRDSTFEKMRADGVVPDETTFHLNVTLPDESVESPYRNRGTIGVSCYGRRRAA